MWCGDPTDYLPPFLAGFSGGQHHRQWGARLPADNRFRFAASEGHNSVKIPTEGIEVILGGVRKAGELPQQNWARPGKRLDSECETVWQLACLGKLISFPRPKWQNVVEMSPRSRVDWQLWCHLSHIGNTDSTALEVNHTNEPEK